MTVLLCFLSFAGGVVVTRLYFNKAVAKYKELKEDVKEGITKGISKI